jgi:hypothetical protein
MRFFYNVLLGIPALATAQATIPLPNPTGPFAVAMTALDMIDTCRPDPYAPPSSPHARRLMVSNYIPVNKTLTACEPYLTPYMGPVTAAAFSQQLAALGLPNGLLEQLYLPLCEPRESADETKYPLVVFSHGFRGGRDLYSATALWLASRGYAVMVVDHPYDAVVVEFQDGTVNPAVDIDVSNRTALENLLQVRTSFPDSQYRYSQYLLDPRARRPLRHQQSTAQQRIIHRTH